MRPPASLPLFAAPRLSASTICRGWYVHRLHRGHAQKLLKLTHIVYDTKAKLILYMGIAGFF